FCVCYCPKKGELYTLVADWTLPTEKSRVSGDKRIAVGGAKPRQRRSETHGQMPPVPVRLAA
ncbi:MAG: hypothetical protein IKP00_17085, partial [Victivallales bacterium]|nr:hypothetical protein [Victivallales bacterium]